jgi:heat shock protein HslJ
VLNVPIPSISCPRTSARLARVAVVVFSLASALVAAAQPVALTGTYWRLTQLNGETVAVAEGTLLPHIALHGDTERVAGFGGCNRFFGRYSSTDTAISIQPLGGTRAACPETDALEQSFLRALALADHYDVGDRQLTLSGDGRQILVFEAVADRAQAGDSQ